MTHFEKHYMLGLIAIATVSAYLIALWMSWQGKTLSRRAEIASGVVAVMMLAVGIVLVHFAPSHPSGYRYSAWADGMSSSWAPLSVGACVAEKAVVNRNARGFSAALAIGWVLMAAMFAAVTVYVARLG